MSDMSMILGLAAVFFAAFLVSGLSCALLRRISPALGLVDKPGERKIHHRVMPTSGGLGIWLGLLLPMGVLYAFALAAADALKSDPSLAQFWGIPLPELFRVHAPGIVSQGKSLGVLLGLGSILTVMGILDDRFNLGWKIRFLVQFAVAAAAVAFGWEATGFIPCPVLTKILSVLWIVGLTNSFNLLDNMDALSSGVAMICASFLAAVMFAFAGNPLSGESQIFMGGFLITFIGAVFGFWVHNWHPARIFMGSSGAYLIGFFLATTTLAATFAGPDTPRQAIFTPLCILAVPLYDTASVIVIRLRNGKSPFVGDKNHYSHRLVALGLTPPQAVLTIYLTTIICGISALFLYQVGFCSAIFALLQVILTLTLVGILEFTARRKLPPQ